VGFYTFLDVIISYLFALTAGHRRKGKEVELWSRKIFPTSKFSECKQYDEERPTEIESNERHTSQERRR
jgi:hypothetical protein